VTKPPSRRRISELAAEFLSAEYQPKKSASRIRRRIFAAVNPLEKFGHLNKN